MSRIDVYCVGNLSAIQEVTDAIKEVGGDAYAGQYVGMHYCLNVDVSDDKLYELSRTIFEHPQVIDLTVISRDQGDES